VGPASPPSIYRNNEKHRRALSCACCFFLFSFFFLFTSFEFPYFPFVIQCGFSFSFHFSHALHAFRVFTLNYLFHVIIIIIIIIIILLLLLHIARASAQRQLMTLRLHRYLCLYSFCIWYYIHIYYVSRVRFLSERKSHMSLRRSVKWHFTLKFVFRQIQESRLLVRVVCMSYMFRVCVCVCVCACISVNIYHSITNDNNCQFSKFTFSERNIIFFFFLQRSYLHRRVYLAK